MTAASSRRWWVLTGTSLGLFLMMLDSTVVTLALPSIQSELDASSSELQWMMNAYLLVVAVLVVTAGRLGDMHGRRRLFLAGTAVFGLGSLLATIAPSPEALIGARVVMAVGGAAILSLSLALVTGVFPASEQARALGIWTAVSSIALGIGPLAGGILVDVDWRLIFAINLPVAVAAFTITRASAPEIRDPNASARIDLPGLIVMTASLGAVVLALVEGPEWGLASAKTLILLAGGLAGLGAFWVIEHRVADPIIDFELFRNRPYLGATAAAFAAVGTYWTVMYYEPQYLQTILGYSPTEAGILILPVTVPMIAISPLAGRLIGAFGARALMSCGVALTVIGLVCLTLITPASGYWRVFPGLLLFGVALGFVYAPMSAAAMAAMPRAKAGIAAGVLAMNRVLAGAVGLALVGAVFGGLQADQLDEGNGAREAYTYALSDALWVLVAITLVCAALTWWLVPPKPTPRSEAERSEPSRHHLHGRHHI